MDAEAGEYVLGAGVGESAVGGRGGGEGEERGEGGGVVGCVHVGVEGEVVHVDCWDVVGVWVGDESVLCSW